MENNFLMMYNSVININEDEKFATMCCRKHGKR